MIFSVRSKKLLAAGVSIIILMLLILFPEYSSKGTATGLKYCSEIIIPSLFPFMVLSGFIIRTGAGEIIGKLLSPLIKNLFFLPQCCAACIFLALTGGFPVGAKCTALLYREGKINESEVQRLMCFCVCGGPAFMITGIGAVMLGNITAGTVLYISQLISCLITGIACGIYSRKNKKTTDAKDNRISKNRVCNMGEAFILSVRDSAASVISMSAMIAIFSMFMEIISFVGFYDIIENAFAAAGADTRYAGMILPVLLEVTGGCKAVISSSLPLWCFSLCTGFGGMCIHLQIFEILGDIPLNKKKFIAFRFINSFLSAAITYIICIIWNPSADVFAAGGGCSGHFTSASYAGSGALVIMSVLFVLTMHRGRRIN